jgi:hypothetical protein
MLITIDTEQVDKAGLTILEYILLYLLYNDFKETFDINLSVIKSLETKGYVKDLESGITLRKKAIDLFKTTSIPTKPKDLDDFVDKYRLLFPSGVKSGNRLVKGDRIGCLTKLKAFKVKYPEYTQDDILEATKVYIDICRKRNFDKMTSADYFIEKDKISQLASYCEDIKTRGSQQISFTNTGIGKTKSI